MKMSRKDLEKIRGHEIGMIFQEPMTTLNPVVKIETQITECLPKTMNRAEKKKQAEELLKMVGITDAGQRLSAYSYELSGGMRQRVIIAIALAAGPKLLLADEPTTALDVTIQDQILKLLMNLKQELKMSMILVTHDLGVASQTCDRIAVMYAGKIVEMSDVHALFLNPCHPYTRGLLESIPAISKKGSRLIPIEGMPPNLKNCQRDVHLRHAVASAVPFVFSRNHSFMKWRRGIFPGVISGESRRVRKKHEE